MEDKVHGRDGERLLLPALQDVRGELPGGVHIAENVRTLRHHINRTVFGLWEG